MSRNVILKPTGGLDQNFLLVKLKIIAAFVPSTNA